MTQYELFDKTPAQSFDAWIHTPEGRHTANLFIRIAWGVWQGGHKQFGAKAIVERIRWHYHIRKGRGEQYRINNNHTASLARFAVQHEPRLAGMFQMRATGRNNKPNKAVVIPVRSRL